VRGAYALIARSVVLIWQGVIWRGARCGRFGARCGRFLTALRYVALREPLGTQAEGWVGPRNPGQNNLAARPSNIKRRFLGCPRRGSSPSSGRPPSQQPWIATPPERTARLHSQNARPERTARAQPERTARTHSQNAQPECTTRAHNQNERTTRAHHPNATPQSKPQAYLMPEARFIALVRAPVERAFAAWDEDRRAGYEIRSFAVAVVQELPIARGCVYPLVLYWGQRGCIFGALSRRIHSDPRLEATPRI
jgi:hypothetical protein